MMCDKGEQTEPQNSAEETTDAKHRKTEHSPPANSTSMGRRNKEEEEGALDGLSQQSFILEKQVKALGLPAQHLWQ